MPCRFSGVFANVKKQVSDELALSTSSLVQLRRRRKGNGCHGRAGETPNIATIEKESGSNLTTASDISSPLFPNTPQENNAAEHHRIESTAAISQVHPLPPECLEIGCGFHAAHAEEERTFSQFCEAGKTSAHSPSGHCFGTPPQLSHDFHIDWDTSFDQMMKSNTEEWNYSLPFEQGRLW